MSLRIFAVPVFCALLAARSGHATDWCVSGTDSDEHAGTSAESAFRTLQKAAGSVQPGDTVLIGDGIYNNAETGGHDTVGSPGLDGGTGELPQPKDVLGVSRPAGRGRDRGASEQ